MRNAEGETQKTVWTSSPDNCYHQLSLMTLAYITCSEWPSTHDDTVPDTVQEHLTLIRCIPRGRNNTSNHISCVHCHHTMVTDSKRRKLRFRRTSALIQGRLDWKWLKPDLEHRFDVKYIHVLPHPTLYRNSTLTTFRHVNNEYFWGRPSKSQLLRGRKR